MSPTITFDSAFFYLCLTLLVVANCILAEKSLKYGYIFAILNFILLSFVAGFRGYSVGRDTPDYVEVFLDPSTTNVRVEFMFRTICRVLMAIVPSPTFLLIIFAVIIYGLISLRLWEMKEQCSFIYSFLTFYCLYFFESMNATRQFVAVAIVFWGSRFIQKRAYGKYLLCILVGLVFHLTSLVGLVMLIPEFFAWKKLSKTNKIILFSTFFGGVSVGVYALLSGLVAKTLKAYLHYFVGGKLDVGLRMIAMIGIFLLALFVFRPNNEKDLKNSFGELIPLTKYNYVVATLLGFVGYYAKTVGRINLYFALFFGVYFGLLAKEEKKINRIILKIPILFVLIYSAISYIWFVNGGYHHPYVFVWE